jgi:hypothetical protein
VQTSVPTIPVRPRVVDGLEWCRVRLDANALALNPRGKFVRGGRGFATAEISRG